jgi:quinol monooxygenase YgiN
MIIVSGTVEFAADDVDRALRALRVMAQETRAEDGCVVYEFSRLIDHPTRFRVYEEWRDKASLAAHGKSAHMQRFRAALGDLNVLSRDIFMVEAGARIPI